MSSLYLPPNGAKTNFHLHHPNILPKKQGLIQCKFNLLQNVFTAKIWTKGMWELSCPMYPLNIVLFLLAE